MKIDVTLATQDGVNHKAQALVGPTSSWQKAWLVLDGLLGVHTYLRALPNGDIQFGVRFSCGLTHADGTGFAGRLYFSSLTLQVDGVTIRVVPDGQHVFPPRAILGRRYTIRGQTVTRGWSYEDVVIPDPAPRFGPGLDVLPPVSREYYGNVFGDMHARLSDALATGSPCTIYPWGTNGPAPAIDLRTSALGPFHPDGYPEAGAPAGYGIDASVGWEQCTESLDFAALAHECAMDRNPVAAYHIDTGEIIGCLDWKTNYLAHGQLTKQEPTSRLELPAFLVGDYSTFHYPNANTGTCRYQAQLEAYEPDNTEHLIRAIRRACILAGWANDPMAIDDLKAIYEFHRTLFYGDRPDDKTHSTDGSYVPPSLSALSYYVTLNPGHGAYVLRSFGWMMFCGAWAKASPSWSSRMIDTYLGMCDKFGLPQREPHLPYIPSGWMGTQHFHSVLIHIGAWTLSRSIHWRERDVCAMIDRWQTNVLLNRAMPVKNGAPPKWIYTQGPQGEVAKLETVNSSPEVMPEHILALVGRRAQSAYEVSGANVAAKELNSGLSIEHPAPDLMTKLVQMRSHVGDQSQYAGFWRMLEEVTP